MMRRWLILNAILIFVVVVLVWQIVLTWARSLPTIEVTSRPPPPSASGPREHGRRGGAGKGGAPAQQEPTALVKAIAEKDLFDPSRQPPPAEEAKKADVPVVTQPPPGLTVVGVRIVGRDREAFVTDSAQGNQQRRLRVGDQVSGYTVKSVEPTGLTLSSPSGDVVVMPLTLDKGKPGPAHPARPGATGQPSASPAAGIQGASTAAGIPVKPPQPAVPTPPAPIPVPGVPAATPPHPASPNPQLPVDVRQKLEQLKQKEGSGRLGRRQQH